MSAWKSLSLVLTGGDKFLIVALLALSLGSIAVVGRLVEKGSVALVEVDGKEICRLDLAIEGHRVVQGPLGGTVVQVRDGRIRVTESACPHKLCVRMGWAKRAGDLIVCVPNRVVVRVEGEGAVDAVTW
jgi:hypothetical protein